MSPPALTKNFHKSGNLETGEPRFNTPGSPTTEAADLRPLEKGREGKGRDRKEGKGEDGKEWKEREGRNERDDENPDALPTKMMITEIAEVYTG